MKTYSINTLGCKVNQYESQQIRELLESFGFIELDKTAKSDLVIINTCCVTHTASAKSRQYIRRIQGLNPNAEIVVCGCLPTVQIDELTLPANNIHFVKRRDDLAAVLNTIANSQNHTWNIQGCSNNLIKPENNCKIKHKKELYKITKLPLLTYFKGQTRAFLKVQDGCDGYCTYCIVPSTRPFVRNKPPETVLKEAQALVEAGHKEIVITGIFLGAYGQETVRRKKWPGEENDKLGNLLEGIAQIPGLKRIRLSSLEPADVTERLLDVFCSYSNIMPHLHLSVQSGSDSVLKKMCRQYNADHVRETVELLKKRLHKPAITADIIVGFPGETDKDFEQTLGLARDAGFSKIHVFRFSPRKGTPAADMQQTVNNKVKKERSKIMHDLDFELGKNFREKFIGQTDEILIEKAGMKAKGRSKRYFVVEVIGSGPKLKKNDLVEVRLCNNNESEIFGEYISHI